VPVDNCSMAVLMARALVFIAFCEYKALTFVLITVMISLQFQCKRHELAALVGWYPVSNSTGTLPAQLD